MTNDEKELVQVVKSMRETIQVLSDALQDCDEIARANVATSWSLAIREIAHKAVTEALELMEAKDV